MFGERLKGLRRALDLTQAQLADLVGLSQPTINMLEKSKRLPSYATIRALAAALEVTPAALLTPVSTPDPAAPVAV